MRVMRVANVSNVDWNLFLVLHTVLEEGSATRAAKRLHVTQSAVSNALARLRIVLDDPLVVRIGNQLVPTAKARALAPHVRMAVAEITEVLSPTRAFDPASSTRRFVLATSDDVELWLLGPLLDEMARELPAAGLRVVSLDSATAASGLGTGEIDAVVGMVDAVPSGCAAEELCEDDLVLLVGQTHPLSASQRSTSRASLATLSEYPGIAVDSKLDVARVLERVLEESGVKTRAGLHVSTFVAAAMATSRTRAFVALPRRAATALGASLPVRALPIPGATGRLSISLVWHARSDADPGAARFRDVVRAAATARGGAEATATRSTKRAATRSTQPTRPRKKK